MVSLIALGAKVDELENSIGSGDYMNRAASNAVGDFFTRIKWLSRGIGEFYIADSGETGVDIPPMDQGLGFGVWVELTAGLTGTGQFNNGKITGESVSGSAPNIIATAVVAVAGSPMNGQVIDLINTERRFLRAGSAGTKEQSQNLSHSHTGTAASAGAHGGHTNSSPQINTSSGGANQWVGTASGGAHTHTLAINADGGTEARPANVGVRVFRRIG